MYYNGTMMNVNSSTTSLTFTAPSLPNGVFTGTVVVTVTASNRYGIGPPSDSDTAIITGTYICVCVCVCVRVLVHVRVYVCFETPLTPCRMNANSTCVHLFVSLAEEAIVRVRGALC